MKISLYEILYQIIILYELNVLAVLQPLVFIFVGNCSDMLPQVRFSTESVFINLTYNSPNIRCLSSMFTNVHEAL